MRVWDIVRMLLLGIISCAAVGCAQRDFLTLRGRVPADWPALQEVPVVVPLLETTDGRTPWRAEVAVEGSWTPDSVHVQVEPGDAVAGTPRRAWFLWTARPGDLGRKVAVRFDLRDTNVAFAPPERWTRVENDLAHVEESCCGRVLSFRHGAPEAGKRYPLTDFIHPLIGLDGEVLTSSSPPDHPHHRGVYWAWVRQERNGQDLGEWWQPRDCHLDPGELQPIDSLCLVYAGFKASHKWVHQPQGTAQGEPFIDEQVVCRVFPPTETGRAVDIDVTLRALTDGVRIGGTLAKDKGYGGFTARFSDATEVRIEADGRILEEADLNHVRANWTDWTGRFKLPNGDRSDHRTGAAIFIHPSHPDRPPEWITRHYGPMNVAYPGLNMLAIPKDQPLHLRYRLWIHRGDVAAGRVESQYKAFTSDWKWSPS